MSSQNAALRAATQARLRHQRSSSRGASSTNSSVSKSDSGRESTPILKSTDSTTVNRNVDSNRQDGNKEIESATDRSTNWNDSNTVALPPRPRRIVDAAIKAANSMPASSAATYHSHNSSAHSTTSVPTAQRANQTSIPDTPLHGTPINTPKNSLQSNIYATPNAAYAALPNRDDTSTIDTATVGEYGSVEDPKTPATLMRSIQRSISKERSEIDGRALFDDKENGSNGQRNNNSNGGSNRSGANGSRGQNGTTNGGTDSNNLSSESAEEYEETQSTSPQTREINSHCLPYGTEIILRHISPNTLASLSIQPINSTEMNTEKRQCLIANESHGSFIVEHQRFEILSTNEECMYLCYGDVVTLKSTVVDRVLGIQKMEILQDGVAAVGVKVGCFRRFGKFPPADRWVVLKGGANLVELGPDLPHEATGVPVYSGDVVVLRNDFTGGLLSLGDVFEVPQNEQELAPQSESLEVTGWNLNLITSSYQMHNGVASTEEDVELIDFLHRHNQCRPGYNESFRILTADVPTCPDWVYPVDERDLGFLDGSYLMHPNRHESTVEVEEVLWGDEGFERLECGESSRLADLNVEDQETILLEEVVGAMMGLEGQFIRYHVGGDLDTTDGENDATQPGFVFAPQSFTGGRIDITLEDIVSRILPLASNYVTVNNYVQSSLCNYESGIIARALCEAMGKLLQEHLEFVLSLDEQLREPDKDGKKLSMTMVHARTRQAHRTMSTLYQVVYAVQGKKGGDLLNSLQKLAKYNYSGDSKCNEILMHLLSVCAVHYARMLKSWLNAGRLHDPYKEFMIEITNRKFQSHSLSMKEGIEFVDWCRVNDIHVFANLDSSSEFISPSSTPFGVDRHRSTSHMSTLDKVHTTGRYRRAIHFCHDGIPALETSEQESTAEEDARILMNPLKLSRSIDVAYHKTSDALLKLMLEKYDLLASLHLMKKYFLLDQGDFFVEFVDIADEQLSRCVSTVSRGQVQNAIETSIGRTSDYILESSSTDPQQMSSLAHASQLALALRSYFMKESLVEQLDNVHRQHANKSSKGKTRQKELTGFEALQLEFKHIPFPTSLVLSYDQMRIYQFLFRQIFFAKYVERQLVQLWSDHQLMKQMSSLKEMRKTFCLRRRMIHFIQNFVYYIKFDVIEPNWIELESKLMAAKRHFGNPEASPQASGSFPRTVDDLLAEHNQFLLCVIRQCLLTNSDLIRASCKIMTTCLLFTTQMKLFMGTTKIAHHHETTRSECSNMRHSGLAKQKIDNARKSQFRIQREERTRRCSERISNEVCTENFQHMIARFDNVFSTHLSDFMASLKCNYGETSNDHFTNLFMQLDYNGFVTSSMEEGE